MHWIFKKTWFWLGVICLMTVIAYGNSFQVPFIYDDAGQIVESAFIKNPAFLPKLFTSDYYQLSPKRYRPVTVLFYFIQYAFWRLNPWGYHLFKLLLHLANVILLYRYLRLLRTGSVVALFGAALFSLHPAHTETITCISFLDDPLMFFWFMLSVISATRAVRLINRQWSWYVASLIFYLLALASKELALVLPIWLALQFSIVHFPGFSKRTRFWLGYIIVSLFWVLIRFYLMEKDSWLMASAGPEIGRLHLIVATYLHYLRVAFLPINLCLDYVYPLPGGIFALSVIILIPIALIASIILIILSAKSRYLFLGWGWFLLAILPLGNIIPQPRLIADRYLYLPLVGFSLVIAVLADQLRRKFKKKYSRLIMPISLICIFLWWGSLIREQNRIWGNPRMLWEDILRISPRSATARNNLGSAYLFRGELDLAEEELRLALGNNPPQKFQAVIQTNLALVQWAAGLKDDAIASLKMAVRADPTYAPAVYELGNIYYREGDGSAALQEYRQALRLAPYDYIIYDHLAALSASRGEWKEAAGYARRTVDLNPDFAIGYDHLGIIYANQGMGDEARTQWRRALELDPNLESALNNLAATEGSKEVPKVR